MNNSSGIEWEQANQRYLMAALALVKYRLEGYLARMDGSVIEEDRQDVLQQDMEQVAADMVAPAHISRLCERFELSPFERDLVLLCAGMELDSGCADLCFAIQQQHVYKGSEPMGMRSSAPIYPTFGLALAVFPAAHWSALAPSSSIRRWNLIEIEDHKTLTRSPIRIDEHILHYLVGVTYTDVRLAHLITPFPLAATDTLVPSQSRLVEDLVTIWSDDTQERELAQGGNSSRSAIVHLRGNDTSGKHAVVIAACERCGLKPRLIYSNGLPLEADGLNMMLSLWERDAFLNSTIMVLDCSTLDVGDPARRVALMRVIQQCNSPLLILSQGPLSLAMVSRAIHIFEVPKPVRDEQRQLWRNILYQPEWEAQIEAVIAQFHLSANTIQTVAVNALRQRSEQGVDASIEDGEQRENILWDACRVQTRPAFEELAQRIESRADWKHLILPEVQQRALQEIVAQVRQRKTVYETWGFGEEGARGLGISALFAGASGTGKTLAAEVLANILKLDLYRIDLSTVVSKYIGETEKNLGRIFDAAEEGGVILLFDEADALFGKRSEIKDSHDRYANIEVGYLLQRMETYHGLAILTTNFKHAVDGAFLRRIRFIVHFPFPDMVQRMEIWKHVFPATVPLADVDMNRLARLNVAGGNIRNIALNAAFLAASEKTSVQMKHLLYAARTEYAKLEKPLTEAEIAGWV